MLEVRKIKIGKIIVVKGPMYSSKSTILMMLEKKDQIKGETVYFKVNLKILGMKKATFYTHDKDGISVKGYEIPKDFNIIKSSVLTRKTVSIFIDEYQFLNYKEIHPQIIQIIKAGIDVYIAGLPHDWKGDIFESMAYICAEADTVISTTSIDKETNEEATHNWKTSGDFSKRLEQGDLYIPVSRRKFYELWNKEKMKE